MIGILQVGGQTIEYQWLARPDRKAVTLTYDLEHGLEIVTPLTATVGEVEGYLRQKIRWILEKQRLFENVLPHSPAKEYVSGEKFPLLGYLHELIVEEHAERKPFVVLRQNRLIVTIKPNLALGERRAAVRDTLRAWYSRQAERKLPEQVMLYVPKIGVAPEKVSVLDLDRRWGSCTPSGAIHLNWRLVLAPVRIIDYIAVHELCHLKIPDHSPQFWELVRTLIADYEDRREWLRVNGPTLFL